MINGGEEVSVCRGQKDGEVEGMLGWAPFLFGLEEGFVNIVKLEDFNWLELFTC